MTEDGLRKGANLSNQVCVLGHEIGSSFMAHLREIKDMDRHLAFLKKYPPMCEELQKRISLIATELLIIIDVYEELEVDMRSDKKGVDM